MIQSASLQPTSH